MLLFFLQNDTMRIVWSIHSTEPGDGAGSLKPTLAESRGTQSLYLVQRADQEAPGPDESARTWDLRNRHVQLPPPGDTLYWCKIFRAPDLRNKHHLIRVSRLLFNIPKN